jgi:BlaI family transcriptional regulator, penicillinase repressor
MKPTDSELEILKVLWAKGQATVREVNSILNENREVGYTTTLKIMQLMAQKGLVNRDSTIRTHVYTAAIAQDNVQNNMLDQLLNTAFGGSASKMVLNALGRSNTSQKELDEIKALIQKLEKND